MMNVTDIDQTLSLNSITKSDLKHLEKLQLSSEFSNINYEIYIN